MPFPGEPAPPFEVRDHTGKVTRLSDFRGKSVLLWFYPKADTPGWTIEGRGFRDRLQEFEKKGVQILGISFDTVEENAAFAEKFDFHFPLLSDTDRQVGLAYGACEAPDAPSAKRISFLIDAEGKIKKAYSRVDPGMHPEEVLKDIY